VVLATVGFPPAASGREPTRGRGLSLGLPTAQQRCWRPRRQRAVPARGVTVASVGPHGQARTGRRRRAAMQGVEGRGAGDATRTATGARGSTVTAGSGAGGRCGMAGDEEQRTGHGRARRKNGRKNENERETIKR